MAEGCERARAERDAVDWLVSRTKQLHTRLSERGGSACYALRERVRGLAVPVKHAIIPFAHAWVGKAKKLCPRIGNSQMGKLVPEVVAAQNDQLIRLDKITLAARARIIPHRFVIVTMAIVGRHMCDEYIAPEFLRAAQRPRVTHPTDGDPSHLCRRITGFECVNGVLSIDPAAIQRAEIVEQFLGAHKCIASFYEE